jgi:CheY-like chemotaxis protein
MLTRCPVHRQRYGNKHSVFSANDRRRARASLGVWHRCCVSRQQDQTMARDAGGKTVLVVDDHDSTRFVLSRTLEGLGIAVMRAGDGAEVAELMAANRFDLLVVDLYMPGMNGFEVLRRVRQPDAGFLPAPRTAPTVPVLVISGESHPASIANAKARGANAYLVKPLDIDDFETTVRRLLSDA